MIRFLQSGNKAAKYILAGFLLVLTASMVTYLIPGFMSDSTVTQSGVVASVGGEDIKSQDVMRVVQTQMQARKYPPALAPFLTQQALQTLMQRAEVRYEAQRIGLRVSDEEMRDEMKSGQYKEVFFPGGAWIGQDKYEKLLQDNGTSVGEFEKGLREDLLGRKLFTTVAASATVTPAEVEQAYKEKNTKVKFRYAVINLEDIQKQIKPTDAELKAYYEANKARYQNSVPEKRQIRYFVLNDKDAENKVTVDAGEMQRYYSANQDQYRLPERVKVRHILIKTPAVGPDGKVDQKAVDQARAKAEDILKQLKSGGNFAELAKKNSDDPGSKDAGGELGWIVKGQTVPEFEKTAFSQNPGQLSGIVQTSYGFHIIQTEEKETARVKPFSEVRDSIEKALKQQKIGAFLSKQADQAQDAAQKQGLDKAAAQVGEQVVQSGLISSNDSLPGIGSSKELMSEIFATTEKAGPQMARAPQGYVVFQVTKIEPPKTPTFDEIKDRVASEFKNERANEMLTKRTQELADRAHADHDLAKAAKEAGATLKTSELVTRTAQVPDIGAMAGPASVAFTLKEGEISGPINAGQKGVVLAVLERQEPALNGEEFAKERDQLREQLTEQKREQVLQLFLSNLGTRLEKQGKLKINNAEMNNLQKARS